MTYCPWKIFHARAVRTEFRQVVTKLLAMEYKGAGYIPEGSSEWDYVSLCHLYPVLSISGYYYDNQRGVKNRKNPMVQVLCGIVGDYELLGLHHTKPSLMMARQTLIFKVWGLLEGYSVSSEDDL